MFRADFKIGEILNFWVCFLNDGNFNLSVLKLHQKIKNSSILKPTQKFKNSLVFKLVQNFKNSLDFLKLLKILNFHQF